MSESVSTSPEAFERPVTVWVEHKPSLTARQLLIAITLLLATLFTTLVVGVRLQYNYQHALAAFSDSDASLAFFPISYILESPARLLSGLPFALAVMSILLAHELGHYLLCWRYRVIATPPYFIPAPTLIGTMGAFIMIRSAFPSRKSLFDIGIAGPIAGFVLTVPIAALGFYWSYPVASVPDSAAQLGLPWMFAAFHHVFVWLHLQPHVPLDHFVLHPLAVAGWTGGFATALNLLPGGQLDGGHIVHSWSPTAHRLVSALSLLALIPLAYFYWVGWLVWGVVLFFTAMRRPVIYAEAAMGTGRKWLTVFAAIMLLISISAAPIANAGIVDYAPEWKQDLRQMFLDTMRKK